MRFPIVVNIVNFQYTGGFTGSALLHVNGKGCELIGELRNDPVADAGS